MPSKDTNGKECADEFDCPGIDPPTQSKISNEDLIGELQRLSDALGKTPSKKDTDRHGEYSATTYRDRFGSWSDAQNAAGLEPNGHIPPVDADALLEELDRLADELGEVPTCTAMCNHGEYSYKAYKTSFGNWSSALEAAGFGSRRGGTPFRGTLINELRRMEDELDRRPRTADLADLSEYSHSRYRDEFGSWTGALEAAGFEIESNLSDETLLTELRQLGEKLDKTPSQKDMDEHGPRTVHVYASRFGSWNGAVEAAGFEPNTAIRTNIPTDELVEELHRIAELAGRAPSVNTMNLHGEFSAKAYRDRFGTWNAALEDAGFEPYECLAGEENPDYVGFDYGAGWNAEKREMVRERDGRACQNPGCDRTEEEHKELFGQPHSVHHIQKARSFDDPHKRNHPDNLITLCETDECHGKWEAMSPLRPDAASD